ncbi:MAG: phytoene desaturase, partial [Pseudomonadota bacterium]
ADDFSLYLHRPTATDPSFAPDGCDSFYALVPVPNLQGDINWETQGSVLRDRVVKALQETMLPGLEEHLVHDFWMTPDDFAHDYLSPAGAGFSIAPSFTQSAWFRFHNKAEGPENLYLVGAGTHPGAGLPGVVSSAKVLEKLIAPAAEHARDVPHLQAAE